MSSNRKSKKENTGIFAELSKIKWKDLDHKKVYCAIAILIVVIVLIVVLIVNAVSGGKDEQSENEQEPVTVAEEAVPEKEENPLEVDAYPEINTLIETYFQGLSEGDTDLVAGTVDVLSDEEKRTIEKKKDYIESYNNIICYTKKGLEDNTYVVFASYEMKIYNIETSAPGIMALYVCTADDGSFYIYNGEAPEELTDYVLELAAQEDVAAVISDVDTRYQELIAADEDLGKFAETMLQSQEEETEEEEPEAPAETEETADAQETTDTGEPFTTTVTSNVRIREERSTDSAILDTLAAGTGVTVYANYEDGWSRIDYNGTAGYCMTEYLESTEGASTAQTSGEAGEEEASGETVNKQMQFKETVRIRADRSTDSERVATGYAKELVTVLESYSDGWSKIEYNGTTGYCMTEFLQEPQ